MTIETLKDQNRVKTTMKNWLRKCKSRKLLLLEESRPSSKEKSKSKFLQKPSSRVKKNKKTNRLQFKGFSRTVETNNLNKRSLAK
jgi:hypothetical protein